jgi:Zn-finger nucleic acid-binding protein
MHAETLNCPMCGAAAATDATRCLFCDARLATHACPSCFGMMFLGNKHCPRCGAAASRSEQSDEQSRHCPRCRVELGSVAVGAISLRECERCGGLWVDVQTFEQICADREQQSSVLGGAASVAPAGAKGHGEPDKIRYVPCPECGQLMNRVNFAQCSGVVVDICKGHGTWFDRDELAEIVGFIRAGGLEAARNREKQQLAEERRLLRLEQLAGAKRESASIPGMSDLDARTGIGHTASTLLKLLLD